MIKIVAENFVKREDLYSFMDLAGKLITESRKEAGCISYHLCFDLEDETHLTFMEEWEDEEAIEQHNHSSHFTTYYPKMTTYCYQPGTCYRYKVTEL